MQAITNPSVAGQNGAMLFLGHALRYLVPLFCALVMLAYLLAILLDPYCLLRIMARNDPGVPQVGGAR
jgi:hypothetical protein